MRPASLSAVALAIALFALAPTPSFAAAEYHWIPGGNTIWTDASNWSPPRTTPIGTDRLVFDSGGSVSVIGVTTSGIGQLVIGNSTSVNCTASAGSVLNIAGDTGPDFEIGAGSRLFLAGPNSIFLNLATGATGAIAGTLTALGGGHRLQAIDGSAIAFNAGSSATASLGFTGNLFGVGAGASGLGSVRFKAGSTYTHLAGANPFGAGQPSSVVVFEPGSLYQLNSNVGLALSGRTYANFEYNGSGTATGAGSATCTIDSIVVNSGVLAIEVTGTLNVRGSVRVRPGAFLHLGPTSGSVNYRLSGTVTQALIDSTGSSAIGIVIRPAVTLTIDNPAGVASDGGTGTISVPGTLQFAQGIATMSLNLALTGTTSGSSAATGWVNGRISGYLLPIAIPSYTFAIGTATSYMPVHLSVHGMTKAISTGALVHSDVSYNPTYFAGSQLDTTKLVTQSFLIGILDSTAWTNFDAVMHFNTPDYGAGANPLAFVARKQSYRAGSVTADDLQWRSTPTGARTATSFQAVGVTRRIPSNTNFNFAIGEPTVVRVSALDGQVVEGNGAGVTVPMRIVLSEPAVAPVEVTYQTGAVTAAQGADYEGTSGTISIAPGDTVHVVQVQVVEETIPEDHETFTLALTNATNAVIDRAVATGTILDDDDVTPPSVTVLAPNGGETIIGGASVDLTWSATDNVIVSEVDLFITRDNGANYEVIAWDLPNTGSYSWVATGPLTQLARLQVVVRDHRQQSASDESNATWAIWGTDAVEPVVPQAFALDLVSANPSRGATRARFALPSEQHVRLTVLDVRGRVVAVLVDGVQAAGVHEVEWQGATGTGSAAAGIYFVRIQTEEWTTQRRSVRLR